jgi:anti-sigma-K factor RskA
VNIGQHPELLDKLAAAYALGTLKGGARRRLEAHARQSAAIRARVLLWQERLHAMTELPAPLEAPASVWPRIERVVREELLFAQQPGLTAQGVQSLMNRVQQLRKRLSWWQTGTWLGAAATIAAVVVGVRLHQHSQTELAQTQASFTQQSAQMQASFRAQLDAQPQLRYVAVLADEQSSASVLVTVDARNNRLTIQRVSGFTEADDKSLQLWALPPADATNGRPQSLGVLGSDRILRVNTPVEQIQRTPALAISLEPRGGVPSEGGPTGPVLFKGAVLPATL